MLRKHGRLIGEQIRHIAIDAEGMRKEDFEKDVAHLAVYTQDAIKKAFREDPNQRMQVLDAPTSDPDALILEAAIVEVVPSKVALNSGMVRLL